MGGWLTWSGGSKTGVGLVVEWGVPDCRWSLWGDSGECWRLLGDSAWEGKSTGTRVDTGAEFASCSVKRLVKF